jgi:hypothetical protein
MLFRFREFFGWEEVNFVLVAAVIAVLGLDILV